MCRRGCAHSAAGDGGTRQITSDTRTNLRSAEQETDIAGCEPSSSQRVSVSTRCEGAKLTVALERTSFTQRRLEWMPSELRTRSIPSFPGPRPHVLNEELFKGVLLRERKRVDRSAEPLALLLLTVDDQTLVDPSIWDSAV